MDESCRDCEEDDRIKVSSSTMSTRIRSRSRSSAPARQVLLLAAAATAVACERGGDFFVSAAFCSTSGTVRHRRRNRVHRRARPRPLVPPTSSSSASSSSALSVMSLFPSMEDAIYAAQTAASDLAASTGLSSSGSFSGSITLASLSLLYGAGLLTSFSPCSLGLLPLTVSYISAAAGGDAEGEGGSGGSGSSGGGTLAPTAAFAAGLASVFCGLGLSAAMLGNVFGSTGGGGDDYLSTFLLASLSGGVSIAMGLQLLELINLPLPSFELDVARFESSSSSGTNGEGGGSSSLLFDDDGNILPPDSSAAMPGTQGGGGKGGSLLRTFLLGGSSALVASPCATPVLASILAYVASSRDPVVGSALLLTYTLGYTTPLLIIGASGGQALASARNAAERGDDSWAGKVGGFVTPATAAVLIWYGTGGVLDAVLGDPSLAGLAPILE